MQAQGFFVALDSGCGLHCSAALNLYDLVLVKNGKSDDHIHTKIEPFLHGVTIVAALSWSITLLVGNHFNETGDRVCIGH